VDDNNDRVAQGVNTKIHVANGEEAVEDQAEFLLCYHLIALGVPPLDLFQRQVLEASFQAAGLFSEFEH